MSAQFLSKKFDQESAASLVEYALLLAFIAVVCVVAVKGMGSKVGTRLENAGSSMFSS